MSITYDDLPPYHSAFSQYCKQTNYQSRTRRLLLQGFFWWIKNRLKVEEKNGWHVKLLLIKSEITEANYPRRRRILFFFCIAYALLFISVYHQNSFEILFEDEILFEGIITTNIANWHLGFSRTIALLPKTLQLPHLNFKLDEMLQ